MIPIRDDAPRLGFPFVTLCLICVNVAVFLYQFSLYVESPHVAEAFVETLGTIPLRTTRALAGQYPVFEGLLPVFTSMFLHGGWMHLIGNMWFLWIFGDNVEDELGHGFYVVFYIACGLLAAAAQILADPYSTVPAGGASGAISGVMGAYVVRFPWARIVVLLPLFIFFTTIEVPALLMLVYWFLIQFFSGAASFGQQATGGVAWWAHIGGFVAGAILIWSRPRRRRYQRAFDY
jgi:membrane associated rhomboid family serine protease